MRDNTERPITVEMGTNQLIGRDLSRLVPAVKQALNGSITKKRIPPLWDGHAAERIAQILVSLSRSD